MPKKEVKYMPREIFGPNEYSEYKKYLVGPLKSIKAIETTHSHTTIAYWIPPTTESDGRVCDDCGKKAFFLLYDRDHMAQTSVNLWCEDHVNESFKTWLNEEK